MVTNVRVRMELLENFAIKASTFKKYLHVLKIYKISVHFSDVNECELNPEICDNNSTCINSFGDYECDCFPGFDGKNCSQGTLPKLTVEISLKMFRILLNVGVLIHVDILGYRLVYYDQNIAM